MFELRRHGSSCAVHILGGHQYGDPGPVFDELSQHKTAVEAAFGAPLTWVPGVRPRVRISFTGGYQDKTKWKALNGQLIDGMQRLEIAITPALALLQTRPPSKGLAEDDDQGDVDEPEEAEGGGQNHEL